ncbi:MAG: hypothetical protein U0575_15835 [Phycisphaerales bacterium]
MRRRLSARIDPFGAPAHALRRFDVLGQVVEEEDLLAAAADEPLEREVDRRLGLWSPMMRCVRAQRMSRDG